MTPDQPHPIWGTRRSRRIAGVGCLIVLGLFVVVVLFAMSFDRTAPQPSNVRTKPIPAPEVAIDTDYLPVLNVDLRYAHPDTSADFIEAVAGATANVAGKIASVPAEARSLTAVNFTVTDSAAATGSQLLLHFTIQGGPLLEAVNKHRPAPFYLTITSEAGSNTAEARRAVEAYCGATSIAFCEQSDGQ